MYEKDCRMVPWSIRPGWSVYQHVGQSNTTIALKDPSGRWLTEERHGLEITESELPLFTRAVIDTRSRQLTALLEVMRERGDFDRGSFC